MVRLGDVCEILNGYAFRSENYTDTGVRIIRISNVQKGYIEDNTPVFYPFNDINVEKYKLFEGDVLLSLTGNVGRVGLLEKKFLPAALNQRVACIRIKDDTTLDKSFLFNLLNSDSFEQKCILSSKGVAQKNMSTEWLKDYKISLPPLDEQRKIAAVLDKVSDLIAKRRQQLDKLNELIKARFVEMFGDEHHLDDWNCVSVGEVADICVGVVIKPTQYYTDQGGVPAFRSLNIGAMTIKNADWVYFTKEGHEKNKKSIVCENDVLVVRSGAPGTACVVTKEFSGYNAVDIIIAHPNIEKINSVFLAMFTNMPHGMNQIREKTGGAAQQHFNVGGYKELTVILPPIELQNQFAAFVEQTEKTKTAISKSLEKLETLKKALMQEYFG